jgi:hypothetical protein
MLTWLPGVMSAKSANDSTVDEILAHYERAIAGKAAFQKVNTMVIRDTIDFPSNNLSGTTAEYFKAPDHFLAITEIPGYGTVRTIYDGKSAWTEDPKQGVKEMTGAALADIRQRSDIRWHVKLKELYPGLKVHGSESIEDREAWILQVTQNQWRFDLCFDKATGLMVRFDTDTGEEGGTSKVLIGDYRPVGKVQFSYAATLYTTKVIWRRKLTDVEFNAPVDDAMFLASAKKAPS